MSLKLLLQALVGSAAAAPTLDRSHDQQPIWQHKFHTWFCNHHPNSRWCQAEEDAIVKSTVHGTKPSPKLLGADDTPSPSTLCTALAGTIADRLDQGLLEDKETFEAALDTAGLPGLEVVKASPASVEKAACEQASPALAVNVVFSLDGALEETLYSTAGKDQLRMAIASVAGVGKERIEVSVTAGSSVVKAKLQFDIDPYICYGANGSISICSSALIALLADPAVTLTSMRSLPTPSIHTFALDLVEHFEHERTEYLEYLDYLKFLDYVEYVKHYLKHLEYLQVKQEDVELGRAPDQYYDEGGSR